MLTAWDAVETSESVAADTEGSNGGMADTFNTTALLLKECPPCEHPTW